MLASVLNRQILIPKVSEGGALGIAMIVAVGVGAFKDLDEAASKSIPIDPEIQKQILPGYEKYKRFIDQVYPLWEKEEPVLEEI